MRRETVASKRESALRGLQTMVVKVSKRDFWERFRIFDRIPVCRGSGPAHPGRVALRDCLALHQNGHVMLERRLLRASLQTGLLAALIGCSHPSKDNGGGGNG